MTIGDRIEAHLTQANEIDTSSRLEKARWQAAYDVLSKLGGAELAGLRSRLQTLESLSRES